MQAASKQTIRFSRFTMSANDTLLFGKGSIIPPKEGGEWVDSPIQGRLYRNPKSGKKQITLEGPSSLGPVAKLAVLTESSDKTDSEGHAYTYFVGVSNNIVYRASVYADKAFVSISTGEDISSWAGKSESASATSI